MKNREIYFRDPDTLELLNNGVSKVSEIGQDEAQIRTLRFELKTFVCEGEYARGAERILRAFLDGLSREQQKAAWVSGFFGSGKSHLVKVLRYLWEDYRFPDGASARSLVNLPNSVKDLLIELSNRSKAVGGLRAAAGTLGAGTMDNVRLAFIQLLLRAAGLPENLAQARFMLWLRSSGLEPAVVEALGKNNRQLRKEVASLKLSTPLTEALVAADSGYGSVANAQEAIRQQFPEVTSPTISDTIGLIHQIFDINGSLPYTLLVVDEIQQFIGDQIQRSNDVQEIVEHCCTDLDSRLLFIGTGQSALNTTANLQRLQARFGVSVQLSDTDVESVIRKTVLLKKPDAENSVAACLAANQGEISRHLQNTRFAATHDDESFFVADYPLLPTRRRFWEKVLRNTDSSGTKAQLRSQLQIVFEATRETAPADLGTVVPADFIYDQISTDLLNSGHLEREYDEIIRKPRDGSPEGQLASRICALIFLIGKLPKSHGADDGVRATAETLVDLLVSDLKNDRPKLEREVPEILKRLTDDGRIMAVENEYRLQTRESARWSSDFNRRLTAVLADDQRINSKRTELLREALKTELKPVSTVPHGNSKLARKVEAELTSIRPQTGSSSVTLWMRDGWNVDEKSVVSDARAAGSESALLFGYLPRLHHEELRQAIAAQIAARETLDAHGPATTSEAVEARQSVDTRLQVASHRVQELLGKIVREARVFLGGGQEVDADSLAQKVRQSAESALVRLFPQFSEADHALWGQVVSRARGGEAGALAQVGYAGETIRHPVCRKILDAIGSGKKGKDLHENFMSSPYGWPKDAIDGSLYALLVAGNLIAEENHQKVGISTLTQNKIGVTTFKVDVPPLTVQQKLELKALYQKLEVATPSGKESESTATFLTKLLALADSAGGESPRPARPDTQPIKALQMLSGNAQSLAIHEKRAEITGWIESWKKTAKGIAQRWPAWERLLTLHGYATELPVAQSVGQDIAAILENRKLLSDPDPLPALTALLTSALRDKLGELRNSLEKAFVSGQKKLDNSDHWKKLADDQKAGLIATHQLAPPPPEPHGTDDDILASLQQSSLVNRRNLIDATPQRFQQALKQAAALVAPSAVRYAPPSRTIHNAEELDRWLAEVRKQILEKLENSPVIL